MENNKSFKFTDEALAFCDNLAFECLGDVVRKRSIPECKAVLYENKTFGDYLLVCTDGSVLFTPAEVGVKSLLAGFKNGLRSDLKVVKSSAA